MPSTADYVQRCGQYLNVFKMKTVTDDPSTNSAGGRPGFPESGGTGKITRAVLDAAAVILSLIAMNPTHPRRAGLMTATQLPTSGALLPAHAGPIGAVVLGTAVVTGPPISVTNGVHGCRIPPDELLRLITNPLGLTLNTGYYALDGERILYSSPAGTVDLVVLPDPPNPALVPSEFAEAVIARALSFLFPFEGEKLGAAQHFDTIATRYEQMVAANQTPPAVPEYVV